MKYNITIFIFILSLYNLANAQNLGKEAWNWQFGNTCALNFSSGTPVIGSSAINTDEGCASISDINTGQLLFYTDGISVWNKNNIKMPNGLGLLGNSSTTQSALIVPMPGNSDLYYIISCDANAGPNGVCYSVVDVTLNGGLGDITTKNILLTSPPTTEKLTAIKHLNNIDYWILDHLFNSNSFNAYLVTSSGINTSPVVSSIGSVENNVSNASIETIGYLKASPNGKKIALVIEAGIPILEIYNFDNSTGKVTNPVTINYSGFYNGPYGVSFSPDNSKLFVSAPDTGFLYQYDLSKDSSAAIIASQTIIKSAYSGAALQLAPNGKIYIANDGQQYLSVINNPNNSGVACNYEDSVIKFSMGNCNYGLPNFIDAINYSQPNNIESFRENLYLKFYPNPNNGTIFFDYSLNGNTHLEISDINGRLIETYILLETTNHFETRSEFLQNGIYFYSITDNQNTVIKTGKIVVMKQ